ncbi:MAG: hypothetical protein A3A82_02765 [Candidatus Pacebacteria bacterium RIFCSPLOWO2_01_FULL_47_12]|nr:MAG: hypothetical protein A3A82_02765 [Candidatus Pacebacteria bacterium RIFCSPLOWO2_01_FULL_47_12]
MSKTISVVICTNLLRKKQLRRCLLSVLCQTTQPNEVLIISHGVIDKKAFDFVRAFKLLRIIHTNAKNPAELRNIAIKLALSKIIAFIDDDAFASRMWIENILATFAKNSPAIVTGPIQASNSSNYWSKFSELLVSPISDGEQDCWFVIGANFAINKHFFLQHKLRHSIMFNYGEDNQISIAVMQAGGSIRYSQECSVFHDYRFSLKDFYVQQKNFAKYEYFLMRVQQYNYFGFLEYVRLPYLLLPIFIYRNFLLLRKVGARWMIGVLIKELSVLIGLAEGIFAWKEFYRANAVEIGKLRAQAKKLN